MIGDGLGFTVIVIVVVVAHCPAAGVNVYVVVTVLFNAGAHDPVIPFSDVVGNGFRIPPEQIGPTWLNAGTMGEPITPTVILNVAVHALLSFTVMM